MADAQFTIKAVARRTGLTPHVIRVWEKRYAAVTPCRSGTNRRLYSEAETERLRLLRGATLAGHSIGSVANLPNEKLAELAQAMGGADQGSGATKALDEGRGATPDYVGECVAAIRSLDSQGFESVLSRAIVSLGQHGLLEKLIGPLAQRVGDLWRDGSITAAHEHFATAVIRTFLGRNSQPFAASRKTPTLVVATPSGQLHELGAIMVGAAANDLGWRVVYLGASLPAADIAGAAVRNEALAVALSIVYPADDSNLPNELENLRRYLPPHIRIIAGGRSASGYREVLNKIGASVTTHLTEFYAILDALRRPNKNGA